MMFQLLLLPTLTYAITCLTQFGYEVSGPLTLCAECQFQGNLLAPGICNYSVPQDPTAVAEVLLTVKTSMILASHPNLGSFVANVMTRVI
jgi:hypothetical protein